MDQEEQLTETPTISTNPIVNTVTYTTVRILEIKYIEEVVETTYANGTTKQDRHDRAEIHFSVDRDDYTEAPQAAI